MPARHQPALRASQPALPPHVERTRLRLADGARTTVYVARYDLPRTAVRVVRLARPEPLEAWCRANGVAEALVGGFFVRPHGMPLGELRMRGLVRASTPFESPWDLVRGCLHAHRGRLTIARRDELPAAPRGDLLQAGPLLVRGGVPAVEDGVDHEGFSAASGQFDSDITAGRYPRSAIALTRRSLLAVTCDGRADDEAGLTLRELAEALAALGADHALNLDGGGSTSLICDGALRNVPREEHGVVLAGGRPVSTALVFHSR
ncbi:MAG TPA: phosphodiester glycosidase family protein [Solirubrobacteraceae bacterium]